MSFQPTLSDSISLIGDVKIHLSHKDFFIDPQKMDIDDSHIHSCYEIYVNVSGDVSFLHADNIYMIKSGDVIFSEPGEVHHCIFGSPCIHEHYCLWFEATDGSSIIDFIKRNGIDGHIRLNEQNKQKLLSFFDNLEKNGDVFEREVLFLDIVRLLREKETNFYSEQVSIPGKMQKILEYVSESFLDIESVTDIAQKFHVSIPSVNRWFRKYLHLSPSELIRAKKLAYAEKLISNDCSVTEACFLSGFTDCSRFISLFKKNYGKTPLQYKKDDKL